ITAYRKILQEQDYTSKVTAENKILQAQKPEPYNSDMPLTLHPTLTKKNLPLAFFISGDGGWTNFDQAVCENLSEKGMPVIGLDAQKYFWNEKQPKETADDIAKAINHYLEQWNKTSFVLVGYSFGASVAPFIANCFSPEMKETLKGVYCLSPDETGDFEIHISDMLNFNNTEKYDVIREIKMISSLKPVCVFGSEEDSEVRKHFSLTGVKVETIPGSHHYDNNYDALAMIILKDF